MNRLTWARAIEKVNRNEEVNHDWDGWGLGDGVKSENIFSALFLYLFGSIFISNFVFIFVVCILLLAFDFWTVKVRVGW